VPGPARPVVPARVRAGEPGLTRPGPARARARSRTPFILLLIGLLGGGLVSLLLINTTLAQGAFRINALQQKNAALTQQVQALQQQTAQEESPASIAAQAERLGMRPAGRLRFVDLRTGRIYSQPASVPGVIPVPGYVP
jgi:cell division protein FtsB